MVTKQSGTAPQYAQRHEANHAELPMFPFARAANSYDPPHELARLRREGPVHRVQFFDAAPGWIVTRHKEVCEMLSHKGLSNVSQDVWQTSD